MSSRPCVLIDSREKLPLEFSDRVDVETGVTLPAGDYSLRGATALVAIERKSLPDLVASVGRDRNRFLDQMQRLALYQYRLLIIESTPLDISAKLYRGTMRPQSVLGTTMAVLQDFNVAPVFAGPPHLAALMVESYLRRLHRNGVGTEEGEAA